MLNLSRPQVLPIGLDIGFDSIKMLQCRVVGNQLAVVAAARVALPDEVRDDSPARLGVATDMIRRMLKQHSFVGNHIVTTLPREITQIKNLRLPMMPPSELASVVQFEARNVFCLEPEQASINYLPAGEVRQANEVRQEVIVLAVKNDDINNFLEQMHRTGAVVESLDVEPCALFRSIERFIRRKEDEQDVQVVVDVGSRRSQVIIARGRDINFYKTIELGSSHLHESVSRKLGISLEEARGLRRRLMGSPDLTDAATRKDPVRQAVFDATRSIMEELGREISLCLRYYSVTFRGQRPSHVQILGGEGNDARLIAMLNAALTIPVEGGTPLFSVDTSKMRAIDREGTMSQWALALGLTLKVTKTTFAPLNGKSRNDATGPALVVDLNEAIRLADPAEAVHA